MHVGEQLRAANWQQGDLIEAYPGTCWIDEDASGKRIPKLKIPGELTPGLVLSQTCDIVADDKKERFVEIAKVAISPEAQVEQWRRGHQRRFVVNVAERQVADIRYCTRVPKTLLLKMRRVGAVAPERRLQFRNWLTARFNRPAVSEEHYSALFGPGRAFFEELATREDLVARAARRLQSVRVGVSRTSSTDKVNYSLWLVTEETSSGEASIALAELAAEFRDALKETATMDGWYEVTPSTISHEHWERTLPLETTVMTYGGEGIVGPEPSEYAS